MENLRKLCKLGAHIKWCKVALEQGRTKWRHASVLSHMLSEMLKGKSNEITIHADLPGYQIKGGSIPVHILATSERPDIVIINRSKTQIYLNYQ